MIALSVRSVFDLFVNDMSYLNIKYIQLQDLKKVLSFPPYPGDYLHPVVYACTAVMLLCLLVSIMTYIIHYR